MFWAMLVVSPILDAKGHYLGAVAMVADISARKRVEEDLSKANDRFLKAFYAGPCMSSIADLETGELIDVNDVWLDTFGLRREQAVGKTRDQLGIVLETSVTDAFRKITDGAAGRLEFESSFTAKDGQTVHTLATTEHVELDGRQAALTVSSRYLGAQTGGAGTAGRQRPVLENVPREPRNGVDRGYRNRRAGRRQ